MTPRKTSGTKSPRQNERLLFAFSTPASPSKVVELATRIRNLVVAAGLDPDGDDVTVIIENFNLRSITTARSEVADEAFQVVTDVVTDPEFKHTRVTDRHRAVSGAMSDLLRRFANDDPQVTLPGQRRAVRLPTNAVEAMVVAASSPDAAPVRYTTTTIITPVLRCGSTEENGQESARLVVSGKPYELTISHAAASSAFHDAAKHRGPHRVRVSLAYQISDAGRLFMPTKSLALEVIHAMMPGTGLHFLTEAKALRFQPEDDAT